MPTYFRFQSGEHFLVYQLERPTGSHEAIRMIGETFAWAEAYTA